MTLTLDKILASREWRGSTVIDVGKIGVSVEWTESLAREGGEPWHKFPVERRPPFDDGHWIASVVERPVVEIRHSSGASMRYWGPGSRWGGLTSLVSASELRKRLV